METKLYGVEIHRFSPSRRMEEHKPKPINNNEFGGDMVNLIPEENGSLLKKKSCKQGR